ncbi:LysE family translocator [Ciceribacter sp. L1K22]|uniref:LysE family translocator n=1 Tax=Ciceribacter sp. L1K22 TaxID=2820275 RepID=UPI001ABEA521|nr:LysE family translocator [Ciceribacter sp. L1K22]MBO3759316.1 LysE family translocator [Ciceribacter sp. L1K22]
MTYADSLWLFLLLVAGIIIVPGMDMLYVLANGLTGGRKSGLVATSGMVAGGVVHSLYGTVGTGLLVALAPKLFLPLLIGGAIYMCWIGYTLIRSSITVDTVEGASAVPLPTVFRRAVLTCLMNPKAYLFVIAVYPQFVRPEYGPLWRQGLALGAMTALTQTIVYGAVALAAGRARGLLVGNPAATIWTGRVVGLLLILVALLTAFEGLRGSV